VTGPLEIVAGAAEPGIEVAPDRVVAMTRASLRGVDFRKARFDRFALASCLFLACDFRAIRFDKRWQPLFSARPQNVFRDCHFDGADMRRVKPDQARFERCTFDDAALDGWHSEAAEFIGCRFAGAPGKVTFYGKPSASLGRTLDPVRKRNDFVQNDFRDADLDEVVFTAGIAVLSQRWPSPERYVILDHFPRRLARAKEEIIRWDVQDERVAALDMLKDLAMRFRDQTEIIASRVSASGPAARVQTRVWATLEHLGD
jgi:hypothetical protein